MNRLLELGVTDIRVRAGPGYSLAADQESLQAKLDLVQRYAERVIARFR